MERDEENVTFFVRDEGVGVASSDATKLFTPFWRGPNEQSNDVRGAGLGLAIAREIARSYEGDVALLVEEAPGACFTLQMKRLVTA